MQYQNEKTIREFVEIARGQINTLNAICDRIDFELNKPTKPNLGGFAVDSSDSSRPKYDWRAVAFTPALREVFYLLKNRNYPVTINTICRELDIAPTAARWRLGKLKERGVDIETVRTGKRLAKYRIA